MNLIGQGFAYIFTAANWTGYGAIGGLLVNHLVLSGISIGITIVIALPLGLFIGHTGHGRAIAIPISNATRALPTLGLLAILILLLGIGVLPPVIVLVILGIPPMLAGAYAGLESVDRATIDAARAIGMTELQILLRVEMPLAAGLLVGGLRSTALQIVATVTVASYFALDSLGTLIVNGLATADYVQMIAGSILVTALALVVDGVLALAQRFAVPRGLTRGTVKVRRTTARGGVSALPASAFKEGN